MLFSKVGVYKAEQDGRMFIVELGHAAGDSADWVHVSNPLAEDEVRNFLRHVDLNDTEIEHRIRYAGNGKAVARAATAS